MAGHSTGICWGHQLVSHVLWDNSELIYMASLLYSWSPNDKKRPQSPFLELIWMVISIYFSDHRLWILKDVRAGAGWTVFDIMENDAEYGFVSAGL